jgi:hypothetical protein
VDAFELGQMEEEAIHAWESAEGPQKLPRPGRGSRSVSPSARPRDLRAAPLCPVLGSAQPRPPTSRLDQGGASRPDGGQRRWSTARGLPVPHDGRSGGLPAVPGGERDPDGDSSGVAPAVGPARARSSVQTRGPGAYDRCP